MLRKTPHTHSKITGGHYVIIASRYNTRYVDAMLQAARRRLHQSKAHSVRIIRVPGAFEIPTAAARAARLSDPPPDALICLGVILRGETEHARLIGEAVTQALAQLQVQTGLPLIHEVLLLENLDQARARCLDPHHNRGTEAAESALEMVRILREL